MSERLRWNSDRDGRFEALCPVGSSYDRKATIVHELGVARVYIEGKMILRLSGGIEASRIKAARAVAEAVWNGTAIKEVK